MNQTDAYYFNLGFKDGIEKGAFLGGGSQALAGGEAGPGMLEKLRGLISSNPEIAAALLGGGVGAGAGALGAEDPAMGALIGGGAGAGLGAGGVAAYRHGPALLRRLFGEETPTPSALTEASRQGAMEEYAGRGTEQMTPEQTAALLESVGREGGSRLFEGPLFPKAYEGKAE